MRQTFPFVLAVLTSCSTLSRSFSRSRFFFSFSLPSTLLLPRSGLEIAS